MPRNFDSLIAYLETHGPRKVFAGYWIAYRTDFESRERIVAAEAKLTTIAVRGGRVVPSEPRKSDENRHQEYDAVVRADPDAGFVVLRATARNRSSSLRTRIGYELENARMRSLLEGAGYERTVVGDFVIYRRGSS